MTSPARELAYRPTTPDELHACPVAGCKNRVHRSAPMCGRCWDRLREENYQQYSHVGAAWNDGQHLPDYARRIDAAVETLNALVARRGKVP